MAFLVAGAGMTFALCCLVGPDREWLYLRKPECRKAPFCIFSFLYFRSSKLGLILEMKKATNFSVNGFLSSGGRTRTYDLRVMSPTSYQLLHPAMYILKLFRDSFIIGSANIDIFTQLKRK